MTSAVFLVRFDSLFTLLRKDDYPPRWVEVNPRKNGVDPMKTVQKLCKTLERTSAANAEAARPKMRRAPLCESLEGRQLLNAAWTPPQGFPMWDGAPGKGNLIRQPISIRWTRKVFTGWVVIGPCSPVIRRGPVPTHLSPAARWESPART